MDVNKLKIIYWKIEQQLYLLRSKFSRLPTVEQYNRKPAIDAIVSLTSYPPRYITLYPNLKSLLNQSVRPKAIVLWIAENDFAQLPESIKNLPEQFSDFKIKQCSDLRSYKKIIPALSAYADDNIIICDDDILYPQHWLSALYNAWDGNGKQVLAHRVHQITFDDAKLPKPYNQWIEFSKADFASADLFPTGMGGVLYPSGCFTAQVSDEASFQRLCPAADDIWLFWMARLNGCQIKFTNQKLNFVTLPGTNVGGLAESNVSENGNDRQIQNMIATYGWVD